MKLKFAIHLDPRPRFISLVCGYMLFALYVSFLFCTGAFYFTLGNMSPKYRSKLSCIFLLGLVKSKFVSEYGMDAVLKPIIDDVKRLVSVT